MHSTPSPNLVINGLFVLFLIVASVSDIYFFKIKGTASPIYQFQVCRATSALELYAPLNSLIFVESLIYGVPSTAVCEPYSLSHCLTPAPIDCQLKTYCRFAAPETNISSCGKKPAQYIHGTHRFIPSKLKLFS